MASITWSTVVAAAPQLAVIPLSYQTDVLNYVNTTLDDGLYGGEESFKLRMARTYLAAHMGEMWLRKGTGGAVTGETASASSVAMSYAAPWHGAIDALETTSYGLEFKRLTDSSAAFRMPVVW